MYELIHCPVCGKECSPQAVNCPHCGHPLNQPTPAASRALAGDALNTMGPPPKTWLVESILATVLCCILGVVGIIYAAKVENLWNQGRQVEAFEASKMAKTWTIVAAIIGISIGLIYGVLVAFGMVASIAGH